MADPGFPVGGIDLVGGSLTPETVALQKFLYVKTKESGPLGRRVPGTPPRSANVCRLEGNSEICCVLIREVCFVMDCGCS